MPRCPQDCPSRGSRISEHPDCYPACGGARRPRGAGTGGWRVGLRPGACAARRAAAPGARSGPRVRSPGAGATRDHGDGAERPRGAPPAAPPLGSEVGAPRSPGLARRGVRVMARSPASSGMCSRLGVEWAGEARPGAAHRGAGRKRQVSHRTPGRSQPRTPCWEPVALSSLVRPSGQ